MYLYRHGDAVCHVCGERLRYGVKRKASGWKVYYCCDSESGCNREYTTGLIPLSVVDNRDEVYDRAEEMTP